MNGDSTNAVTTDSRMPGRNATRATLSVPVTLLVASLTALGTETVEAQTHVLTVASVGPGGGIVTSAPSGLDCGIDCTETYSAGTVAILTPTAVAGSAFAAWSGDVDCTDEALWTPSSTLAWDQSDSDADALTYRLYLDGAPQGVLQNVSCETSSLPASCTGDFPSGFTPAVGVYLMQLEAERDAGNTSDLSAGIDASVAGGLVGFPIKVTMDADRSCAATFTAGALFTDDPLIPGVVVKAVHFTELQARINTVRVGCGLSTYSFAAVAAGSAILASDILAMRTALNEAEVACGGPASSFTDPGLGPGTPIKAVHVQELRDAIRP